MYNAPVNRYYLLRNFFFFIIDALQAQVEELSSLLKTVIKGKHKAIDPKDNIIDWEQVEVKIPLKNRHNQAAGSSKSEEYEHVSSKNTPKQAPKQASLSGSSRNVTETVPNRPIYIKDKQDNDIARIWEITSEDEKVTKKTKSQLHLERSRSRDRNRSSSSSSSSSSSPSPSLSASAASSSSSLLQSVLFYEDMDKSIRNALRVTDLFSFIFIYFICLN